MHVVHHQLSSRRYILRRYRQVEPWMPFEIEAYGAGVAVTETELKVKNSGESLVLRSEIPNGRNHEEVINTYWNALRSWVIMSSEGPNSAAAGRHTNSSPPSGSACMFCCMLKLMRSMTSPWNPSRLNSAGVTCSDANRRQYDGSHQPIPVQLRITSLAIRNVKWLKQHPAATAQMQWLCCRMIICGHVITIPSRHRTDRSATHNGARYRTCRTDTGGPASSG